jgi:hypothetical protein
MLEVVYCSIEYRVLIKEVNTFRKSVYAKKMFTSFVKNLYMIFFEYTQLPKRHVSVSEIYQYKDHRGTHNVKELI